MSFHFFRATSQIKTSSQVTSDNSQIIIYPKACERAFLPSFRGSLTIEAAAALPLFMFFMACILHFLILLFLQTNIRTHINEAARDITKRVYVTDGSDTATLAVSNTLAIKSAILKDGFSQTLDNSKIKNGSAGFITALSGYNPEDKMLTIDGSYVYDFPYMPKGIASLSLCQKIKCRAWLGLELSEDGSGSPSASGSDSDKQSVYVTPYGQAYHTDPSCSYLNLSIHSVSKSDVSALRNSSGEKYTKCSCVSGDCSSVYVTDYGNQFHADLNCSDLKRTVSEVDINDIGSRHICPKCAAGE